MQIVGFPMWRYPDKIPPDRIPPQKRVGGGFCPGGILSYTPMWRLKSYARCKSAFHSDMLRFLRLQNDAIRLMYSLEANHAHFTMFWFKNKINVHTHVHSSFYNWCIGRYTLHGYVFVMRRFDVCYGRINSNPPEKQWF